MNFFYKYQKIILASLFFLTVIIFGLLIYKIFFSSFMAPENENKTGENSKHTSETGLPGAEPKKDEAINEEENKIENLIPEYDLQKDLTKRIDEKAQGGITKTSIISENNSIGLGLSTDGKSLQYYNKNNGKFYKIDENGDALELSSKVFHNAENITWSPVEEKAIIEYPDGSNIIYDFENEKQVSLPKHWEKFEFSKTGKDIVAKSIGLDPHNRWLVLSNNSGTQSQKLEMVGQNADSIISSWSPNNQVVAMRTEGIDFDRQTVYFIGKNNENFKSMVVHGRGFQPLWSNNGEKLLYSVYSSDSDMKPSLWMVDASGNNIGNNRKKLNIETWAEKCTYSDFGNIYCAVPEKLERGAGLIPELAENTIDNIYKIDPLTGSKKMIAIPDENFNISEIIISSDEKYLYFKNTKDEAIRKINLK